MFSRLRNAFHTRDDQAIVLDITSLPAWLSEQEAGYREEFRRTAGTSVQRILLAYALIRDQILPLRTDLLFSDDGAPVTAAVDGLIGKFENGPAVLFTGEMGDDIPGFCRDAGEVCRCCESCLLDYGDLLAPAYGDLVAAIRDGAGEIRGEVRRMEPAVEKYAAGSARVAELEQIYTRLYTLAGSVQSSAEIETRASTRIAAYRERIAAIDCDLKQVGEGHAAGGGGEEVRLEQCMTVQETLARSYRDYASILLSITGRAGEIAAARDDIIAGGVFEELHDVLAGRDVPEADTLFSALIDAFPIFMDLIDEGALALEDENEQAVFVDIASFANGLQDICLCYHEMNEKGSLLSVPVPQTAEDIRQELLRDREAIIARVMEESDQVLKAHLLLTVTADDHTDLVQMIEEGIRTMTGRPAQINSGSMMQLA